MFKVYLDLETWAYASSKINNNVYQLSAVEVIQGTQLEFNNIRIIWDSTIPAYTFQFKQNATIVAEYHGDDLIQNIGGSLLINASPSYTLLEDILLLEKGYFIDMVEMVAGVVDAITYKLNDELDVLNKTLTPIDAISGNFNNVVGTKNLDLDINYVDAFFNYIYIPIFKRFYYVTSTEMISADYVRVHLKEDVLMSWKDLIKQQDAFVTRYENSTRVRLVDIRKPVEDVLRVQYKLPTATSSNSVKNTTLDLDLSDNEFKFLISSISNSTHDVHDVPYFDSNLPQLSPLMAKNERVGFLSESTLNYLISAVRNNSAIATFINSVILLPFNPYYVFSAYNSSDINNEAWIAGAPIQASDKYLCTDGNFHTLQEISDSGYTLVQGAQSFLGASPYFVIADFTMPEARDSVNDSLSYLEFEPYTYIELYIPFVGWVKLTNSQVLGKRIIVYYTLDYKTGMGTAYVYDKTSGNILYSTNCQFGIKIDLTTTNAEEITRQKQANELNMILGLMTSALSIGVGVVTENPVAVVGGVLSAGKTIASNVNSNRMLFERAQTSFGTSEGVFHSSITVKLRYTYHLPINVNSTLYKHMQGLPYNDYVSLSTLTGYVEIGEIHFNSKNEVIYQDEIDEIVSLLQNGVIF